MPAGLPQDIDAATQGDGWSNGHAADQAPGSFCHLYGCCGTQADLARRRGASDHASELCAEPDAGHVAGAMMSQSVLLGHVVGPRDYCRGVFQGLSGRLHARTLPRSRLPPGRPVLPPSSSGSSSPLSLPFYPPLPWCFSHPRLALLHDACPLSSPMKTTLTNLLPLYGPLPETLG